MIFRQRPLTIKAMQWFKHGDHPSVLQNQSAQWFNADGVEVFPPCRICGAGMSHHGLVKLIHTDGHPIGEHFVHPGDWLINGVNDEIYPLRPDIFEKTYEPIIN